MEKEKVVTCLHSTLSADFLIRIMHLENAKAFKLDDIFKDSEKVKPVKVLTLKINPSKTPSYVNWLIN